MYVFKSNLICMRCLWRCRQSKNSSEINTQCKRFTRVRKLVTKCDASELKTKFEFLKATKTTMWVCHVSHAFFKHLIDSSCYHRIRTQFLINERDTEGSTTNMRKIDMKTKHMCHRKAIKY